VGDVLTGKVTGITGFGAFVTIAPGKSGLVHISEIANTYVSDISNHLTEGQDVKVKIIGVDKSGRLNLSIKAAMSATAPAFASSAVSRSEPYHRSPQRPQQRTTEPAAPPTFEDKLKRFMQDSDNKMSGLKQYSDKKGARRRGR